MVLEKFRMEASQREEMPQCPCGASPRQRGRNPPPFRGLSGLQVHLYLIYLTVFIRRWLLSLCAKTQCLQFMTLLAFFSFTIPVNIFWGSVPNHYRRKACPACKSAGVCSLWRASFWRGFLFVNLYFYTIYQRRRSFRLCPWEPISHPLVFALSYSLWSVKFMSDTIRICSVEMIARNGDCFFFPGRAGCRYGNVNSWLHTILPILVTQGQ